MLTAPAHISAASSDESLVLQAKAGTQEAFRLLVYRYEGRVAATVIGMLGQGAEAEDVGQEVFIRFYQSLSQFKGEAKVSTYLTRIAINLSLNAIKKRKRKKWLSLGSSDSERVWEIPDANLSEEQRATQAYVQQALQLLDKNSRSVIVLRLIEGYSTKETAEILQIAEGTVLSRLARAQKKLKTVLSYKAL